MVYSHGCAALLQPSHCSRRPCSAAVSSRYTTQDAHTYRTRGRDYLYSFSHEHIYEHRIFSAETNAANPRLKADLCLTCVS